MLAATSASPAMVDLFAINNYMGSYINYDSYDIKVYIATIKSNNIETFRHLLSVTKGNGYSDVLLEILKYKSEEFRLDWEINIEAEYKTWTQPFRSRESKNSFCTRYIQQRLLDTAREDSANIEFILLIWKKLDLVNNVTKLYLGDALVNVAATCCSVKLAKYLIEAGASVDHRRNSAYLTPLHHAVTHTTSEAAELAKFLLGLGADPLVFSGKTGSKKVRQIEDEPGAKGISKWLGMSWNELVEKTAAERREK